VKKRNKKGGGRKRKRKERRRRKKNKSILNLNPNSATIPANGLANHPPPASRPRAGACDPDYLRYIPFLIPMLLKIRKAVILNHVIYPCSLDDDDFMSTQLAPLTQRA